MGNPVHLGVARHSHQGAEQNFRTILGIDLGILFPGFGPLPSVRGKEDERGTWDHPGASRRPRLSDGSSALETLTLVEPPRSIVYDITEITGLLGWLAAQVRTEWLMVPDGDSLGAELSGTTVRWGYAVHPRKYRRLLVRVGLGPLWKMYMRRSLEAVLNEVDRQASAGH
ncbi:SRPBCC family protein [Arthrobacter sp. CJ23]|uniref:SRPBCC family protein n=1 Tax=Arthrobacter sp. CJ23 TaxID=2972479 RepID=UPI00215BEB86|nr:SRPBCC family protein [Arthrobacter sp. CJ23]UVJ38764.1 hypothetical protein NVV90_16315 [Arthrobacter sp. CJ23]